MNEKILKFQNWLKVKNFLLFEETFNRGNILTVEK